MNALRQWLKERAIKAVIPPKPNRKEEIQCEYWLYKEGHVVECVFGKLKHYRRMATRYEKKAINYMGDVVVCIGAFMAKMKCQQNLA